MENFLGLPIKLETKGLKNKDVIPGREYSYTRFDCCSTEIETLEFLYSLVRFIKPRWVLETGTFHGYGAMYLAKALADNDLDAHCLSIEWDQDLYKGALDFIRERKLNLMLNWVTLLEGDSTTFDYTPYMNDGLFDLVFVDCKYRDKAIQNLIDRNLVHKDTIFALHDTARGEVGVARGDAFRSPLEVKLFINQSPRGLMLGKLATETRK